MSALKETIEQRLLEAFPDAKLNLTDTTGTDDHWDLKIASAQLEGLSRVKKHQAIYKPLKDLIASNRVHALNITTFAPDKWPG